MKMLTNNEEVIDYLKHFGKQECIKKLKGNYPHTPHATIYRRINKILSRENFLKKRKPYESELVEFYQLPFDNHHVPQIETTSLESRQIKALKSRARVMDMKLKSQRAELRRKSSSISHQQGKLQKMEENEKRMKSEMMKMEHEIVRLEETMLELRRKMSELESEIQQQSGDTIVISKKGGQFTNSVKECVFKLLDCNVSTGQYH
jgi:chromosome segregation ATPase